MFADMTMEKKLMLANVLLFAVIGLLALFVLTEDRTVPARPPVEEIQQTLAQVRPDPDARREVAEYPAFGKAPIFDTLIPLPTPSPTPPPTPPPDPNLCEALKIWRITGVLDTEVMIEDVKAGQFVVMNYTDSQEFEITHDNTRMRIRLVATSLMDGSATFEWQGPQGRQECKKTIFDE
jgi:hypothetical protein